MGVVAFRNGKSLGFQDSRKTNTNTAPEPKTAPLNAPSPYGSAQSDGSGQTNFAQKPASQSAAQQTGQSFAQQPATQSPVSNWTPTPAASYASPGSSLAQTSPGSGAAAYDPYAGLTEETRQGLSAYGQKYVPSDTVNQARDYLNNTMQGKPGDYSSRYQGMVENLYQEIMNRPKFQYDVNKDPLFQQYRTQYMQTGQRAMQDAMGQAAALSGGYGNSWGNTAGFQAYQYYLSQLNDRVPELEQRAFDRYSAEGDEMRKNLQTAQGLDDTLYGRYRDTVGDWQAQQQLANQQYQFERGQDLAEWQAQQNYFSDLSKQERDAYRYAQQLGLDQDQLAFQRDQAALDEAYRYAQLAENQRQYDNDLGFKQYQAALDEAYRQQQAAEAQRQYNQTFAENQRQYNEDLGFKQYQAALDEAYRQQQAAEAQRQYNTNMDWQRYTYGQDDAYRQAQAAEAQRQYNQNFAENQRQYDTDMAYKQYQAALDEAYRQQQAAEAQRQYEQNFAEDQRQYNTTMDFNRYNTDLDEAYRRAQLAQNQGQFDANLALDQAKFDFQVRQYEEALAKAAGGGSGGGTPKDDGNAGENRVLTGQPPYNPALLDIAKTEASGKAPSDTQLKNLGVTRAQWNEAKANAEKGSTLDRLKADTAALKASNPLNAAQAVSASRLLNANRQQQAAAKPRGRK